MTCQELSKGLEALAQVVSARGGDHSALQKAAALLGDQGETKPADFAKALQKALAGDASAASPFEVRAGAAAEALAALIGVMEATGAKATSVKAAEAVRAALAEHASWSLDSIRAALAAPPAKSAPKKKKAPAKSPA